VGFDINQSRVAELKSGIDTTLEIDDYFAKGIG
jgi:UDP-N-acetyl-D-mannosaminuronate dehydrogenase